MKVVVSNDSFKLAQVFTISRGAMVSAFRMRATANQLNRLMRKYNLLLVR